MTEIGHCHICGTHGPLTREHVPPQGAYRGRDYRVEVVGGEQWIERKRGKVFQRGFHKKVLCQRCNNETGRLYGTEFAEWSRWGFGLLEELRKDSPGEVRPFIGYPSRIAKQVMASMLASSQYEFGAKHPELRDFVQRPDAVLGGLRLRTYLCPTSSGRTSGVAGRLNTETGSVHVMVEFAMPPFGYILTLSGEPQDDRPVDIGWFATCGYDEKRPILLERIPILPTHLPLPEDYRSADEIRLDTIQNILTELSHPDPKVEAARIIAAGEGRTFFEAHGEDWDNIGAA